MSSIQKHIVGNCRWLTQFDSNKEAFAFQSEISKWSKYQMPREIDQVLNKVCPPDKTMIIDTLELDLGKILYDNFHQELPVLFSEKLLEAIQDMLKGSGNRESNLKIVSQDQSYFDTLQYFLQFGYVTSGLHQEENLHNIVELLLTNHKVQSLQMLRELLKEENVRKRIAWQFKDDIIKKVIQELEPSNYTYIIDFTDQVTLIQRKENILNTSLSDFKKNLWFWVFNYLFVERGTMFNKVAFVQSTMMQMARHFNIAYAYLFELIESAVASIDHYKKAEFLSILRILYKQNKKSHVTLKTSQKEMNLYWQELKQFLSDKSKRVLSEKKQYFNELIQNLSLQNPSGFQTLLSQVGSKEEYWESAVPDLTSASLEVVFRTLNAQEGDKIYAQVQALNQLFAATSLKTSSEELASIAIRYAVKSRSKSHTAKSLLSHVIQRLEAKHRGVKEVIFNCIFDEVVEVKKSQELFEIRGAIASLHKEDLQGNKTSLSASKLSRLLKPSTNSHHEKELNFWIDGQPEKVWEFLEKEGKQFQYFVENIELKQAVKFLKIAGRRYQEYTRRIGKIFDEIGLKISEKQLTIIALQVIKKFKNPNESKFVSELVKQLIWKSSSIVDKKDIEEIIKYVEHNQHIKPKSESLDWGVLKKNDKPKNLFEICLEEIKKGEVAKEDILSKIAVLIRDKAIQQDVLEVNEARLIAYIFDGKFSKTRKIFKTLRDKLQSYYPSLSFKDLEIIQKDMYWKSLVQYEVHQGNFSKWIQVFEERMMLRFPKIKEAKLAEEKIDFTKVSMITFKQVEESPDEIITWIEDSKEEVAIQKLLSKELSALEFFGLIKSVIDEPKVTHVDAFLLMHEVIKTKLERIELKNLEDIFWQYGIKLIRGEKPETLFQKLINKVIEHVSLNTSFDADSLIEAFVSKGLHEFIHVEYQRSTTVDKGYSLKKDMKDHDIENLIESTLKSQNIPVWFVNQKRFTPVSLLRELLEQYPHKVTQLLRKNQNHLKSFESLMRSVQLIEILKKIYVHQAIVLNDLVILYRLLGTISDQSIPAELWQQALTRIVIRSWIHANWKPLSPSQLWLELMWEVNKTHSISQKQFVIIVGTLKNALPTRLLTSLRYLEYTKETRRSKPFQIAKKVSSGVPVRNAGLVILNSYFTILFDRLGLLNDKEFINEEGQLKAIHYLQYIVTGLTATEESLLVLNKILCGVDIESPIKESIEMTPKEKELIDGMIESSIAYWSSIGTTSVEGFRGNWLVREGVLKEEEDRWELTVEKRSYDILMQKSPFTFSIIKLPWMKKPLHVTWPF